MILLTNMYRQSLANSSAPQLYIYLYEDVHENAPAAPSRLPNMYQSTAENRPPKVFHFF